MVDVERLQQRLGGCGCYQLLVYTLLSLVYMRGAWHTFGGMFLGAKPSFKCQWAVNQTTANTTLNGECLREGFGAGNKSEVVECRAWNYSTEMYTSTIVSEWDIVCDDDYLVDLSTTIYMIGTAAGAVVITPLSDRFGRKPLMLICLVIQAGFGVGVAFVHSYIVFTLMRCVIGFLNMGISLCAFVTITELFPSCHRTLPSIAVMLFWGLGVMLLSLFAYCVRDWRHLEILISLPNLLTLAYIWLLPESLPWLLSKEKLNEAKKVVRYAVKLNKLPDSPEELMRSCSPGVVDTEQQLPAGPPVEASQTIGYTSLSEERSREENKMAEETSGFIAIEDTDIPKSNPGALDLVRTPRIRLYALIMWFLFFVNSLSYFGISFNTPNLHGNPFLNLFLMGAVEIPAYLICMLINNWGGRRVPVCVFLLICGVSSLVALFVPENLSAIKVTLVMIGKFGITGSYSTIYLLAAEIFPTSVRNQAVGIASFFENIGSISAPFIVFWARKLPILPHVMFGVLTLLGGGLVLLLPETRHRRLPETVHEIESWGVWNNCVTSQTT